MNVVDEFFSKEENKSKFPTERRRRISEQEYLKKRRERFGRSTYLEPIYFNEDKNRYVRIYRGKRSKCIKKSCNRVVRYYKGSMGRNKGQYKKVADYWWTLY